MEIVQTFKNAVMFTKNESLNSSTEFASSTMYAVDEIKKSVTGTKHKRIFEFTDKLRFGCDWLMPINPNDFFTHWNNLIFCDSIFDREVFNFCLVASSITIYFKLNPIQMKSSRYIL